MPTKLKKSIKKIDKQIINKNVEYSAALTKSGKIIGVKTDNKPFEVQAIDVKGSKRNIIDVHNHPSYFIGNVREGLAPSIPDLFAVFSMRYAGGRIIENDYIHTFIPSNKMKYDKNYLPEQYFEGLYNGIYDKIDANWKRKVNTGKMTLAYYYNNLQYEVVKELSDLMGFKYILKQTNKKPVKLWKYPIEVIPPEELPLWLSPMALKIYLDKWEKAVKRYPEVKENAKKGSVVTQ